MNVRRGFSCSALLANADSALLVKCAELYCEVWKEPPWNETWSVPVVVRKLNEAVYRESSVAYLAIDTETGGVLGFTWGFPVSIAELAVISSSDDLCSRFRPEQKIFYLAELGVARPHRGNGLGMELSNLLIRDVRLGGQELIVLRTDLEAVVARKLYQCLGFDELPVADEKFPTRTYWSLNI
jgi:ribosomal protein S18 acetylase RimI-like enzyme